MQDNKNIFQLLISILLLCITLSSDENTRITEELASPMPQIPLQRALGDEAYSEAMNSNQYSYVGSSKCRLCHRKFFLGRKNDPHDSAMKTLETTGNENNSRCLTCHSTGHRVKSGFVNMASTPRLSNVQCEGCHGPGNVHITKAKASLRNKKEKFLGGGFLAGQDNPQKIKKMCTSCHTERWNKSYHDLDKAYNSYKKADPNSK